MKQDKEDRVERDKGRVAHAVQAGVAASLLGPLIGKGRPAAELESPLCCPKPEQSGVDDQ